MQFSEAIVNRRFISRALVASVVLSVFAVLSGVQQAWGQAHPGIAPAGGTPNSPVASTAPADPNAPKLRCDEPIYDFGEVWAGEVVEHEFVIINEGKSPLELLSVHGSCACTATTHDKVIAPGEQGKVTAKLTTTRMAGPLQRNITVQSNDPLKKTMSLGLKGQVKPRVSLEPPTAAFGSTTEQKELTRKIKVTNHTEEKMVIAPIPPLPGQTSVFKAQVAEVEPGKVAEITITAVPPFPDGPSSVTFRFNTGIEKEKEISVPCTLSVPPLVQVIPTLLPVTVPVTKGYVRQVSVIYNGQGDFAIESIKPGNDAIHADASPIAGSKSYRLNVRIDEQFNPPNDNPIDIVIKTNLKEKEELKVSVKPTRIQRPPVQPSEPVAARPEELLGKPTPVTSLTPARVPQPIQIGTNNQVAVVNFWAAWSTQSRRQLATIQSLNMQYFRKGVTFVNISVDPLKTAEEVTQAAQQCGLALNTVVLDPAYATASRFGIKSVPTVVLIGKSGVIEAVHEGFTAPNQAESGYEQMLRSELDLLLEGRTRAEFPAGPKPACTADAMEAQVSLAHADASSRRFTSPTARLTVESTRQDIGEVKPAAPATARVYLRNDGMQPLNIISVATSEGLTVEPGYPTTLASGASAALSCRFTAAAQPSSFEHKLTINSNDAARPKLDITLVGSVQPYLEVQPKTGIDFGRNPRTQTMGRMATIVYNGPDDADIQYLSAESSSPKFEAKVEKLGTSKNAKLVVNPKPPFDLGELNAVIKVQTTCKEQPTIEVPVKLYHPKRVEVTPEAVVVDGTGRMQRYSVTIAYNGLEDLHILGVTKSDNRIRTQFYPEADGFSYKLEMTLPMNFTPSADDKITIRTNDKEFGEIVIPIRRAAASG